MSRLNLDPNNNIALVKSCAQLIYPLNKSLRDLCICQAILESDLRENPSKLAYDYCNLFGIKSNGLTPIGTHGVISLPTHEYINGKITTVMQNFLWNNNIEDSFLQHQRLLKTERYQNLKSAISFNEIATLIQQDGYCTDPQYPQELVTIYRQYIQSENK